jgi:hypothetical protein
VNHRLILAFLTLALAGVLLSILTVSSIAQNARPDRAVRPVPRWPDGRVDLNSPAGEKGLWGGGGRLAVNPKSYDADRGTQSALLHINDVPLQPWARALLDYRHLQALKDEPYTRCKPPAGPRQWATAYGFEIMDVPELQRIFVMNQGGPHTFRIIYMDGRPHPQDLEPSYYGHSVGSWEGDTLVIDVVGFNERTWMSRDALPHTEKLHLIERLTRTDFSTIKYEVTFDDPGAYTTPWTSGFTFRWTQGSELFEYVCQDNNHGPELMVGAEESVDRSSVIVP